MPSASNSGSDCAAVVRLGDDEVLLARVVPAPGVWSAFVPEQELRRLDGRSQHAARDEAISCAGALRWILGRLLGREPTSVPIQRTSQGKPLLLGAPGFSVAHTRGLGLVAVACRGRVGVDLEAVGRVVDCEALAESFFPAHERARLLGEPEPTRQHATLMAFTRFESVVKATGTGLSVPADDFGILSQGLCWQHVDVGRAWVACVAADAPAWSVRVVEASSLLVSS